MAQENIDFGAYPNDPDADAVRVAFQKVQNNFSELFSSALTTGVDQVIAGTGITVDQNIGNVTVTARIPQITIQTGDSLRIGVGVATTNTATISSGSTPFVITLSNTINTVNIVATGNLVGTFAANSSSQPNITSVGTLSSLSVSGNINAQNIIGNIVATSLAATYLGSPGANTQVVYNFQGNLTATSGLTFDGANLTASNRVQSGNLSVTGNANVNILRANYIYGDGSNLTNVNIAAAGTLTAPNLLASGNLIGTLAANVGAQPNITSVGTLTSLSVTGTSNLANVNAGNISATGSANVNILRANFLYGDGSNLTNLSTPTSFSAGNLSVSGNITGRLSTDSALQPNITTVGTLSNLSVAGTVAVPNIAATYISASGNISAPGTNTQVVFNNQGNLAGSANLVFTGTNLNVAANLNATGNISGNNATLAGSINLTGNVSAAGNISTASNLNVSGNAVITGSSRVSGNASVTGKVTAGTISSIGNIDTLGNLNANSVTLTGEANANVVRAVYFVGDGANISNVGTVVPRNEITRLSSYVTIDASGFIHAGDSVNGDQFVIKAGNGLQALNKFSITDGTANYFSSNTTNAYFNLGQTAQGATFQVNATDGAGPQFTITAPSGNTGNSVVNLNGANVTISGTNSSNVTQSSINLTGSTISVIGNLVLNSSPASSTSNTQVATTAFVQNLKANIVSPAFTGIPTAPTAANGTNNTQIATTQFVANAIAAGGGGGGGGGGSNISNGNSIVSTFSDGNVRILAGNGAGTPGTFSVNLNDGTNTNTFHIASGQGNPNAVQTTITANARATAFNIVAGANTYFGNMTLFPTSITMNHPTGIQLNTGTIQANADVYIRGRLFVPGGGGFSVLNNVASATAFNVIGTLNSLGNTNLNIATFNSAPSQDWVVRYTTKALNNSYGSLSTTITAGNVNLQRASTATGTTRGSILVDNSGTNYVTVPASTEWSTLGTNDITIEGWYFYQGGGATNATLFMLGTTTRLGLQFANNNIIIWFGTFGSTAGAAPAANTWTHIALVKSSGVWAVFVNGVLSGAPYGTPFGNSSNYSPTGPLTIGQDPNNATPANTYFAGRITNFRIVLGPNTAVYRENFTPPTNELTAIPGTVLLLTTGTSETAYTDTSGTGKIVTNTATTWGNISPIVNNISRVSIVPAALTGNYTLTLPTNTGSNGQVLSTDGTGNLSWITSTGGNGGGGGGDVTAIFTKSADGTSNVSEILTAREGNAGYIQAYITQTNGSRKRVLNIDSNSNITLNGPTQVYGDILTTGNISSLFYPTNNVLIGSNSITLSSNNIISSGNLSVTGTTRLGSNTNVIITGGTNGQVLSTNGSGALSWITPTGGGGGGSSTVISNANSSVSTFAYGQVVIGTGTMQAVYANTGVSMATGNIALGSGNVILANGYVGVLAITDINNQGFRLQGNNDTHLQHFSASTNGLNFQQWNGSTWNNRLRVDSNGNVGIGTNAPTFPLDIRGINSLGDVSSSITNSNTNPGTSAASYWTSGNVTGVSGAGVGGFGIFSGFATGTASNHGVQIVTANNPKITVLAAGNVGIGTADPVSKLHVHGTLSAGGYSGNGIIQLLATNAAPVSSMLWDGANIALQLNNRTLNGIITLAAGSTERMRIDATGNVGIGTNAPAAKLAVVGAITATDNITAYFSDERLKTKLGTIENALDKVSSLEGFYYEANETAQALGYKVRREVGVSAQQVQKVLPEIVAPAPIDNKYLTIDYERLVPLLIEAIKELRAEVNELKGKK